jgi:hypothetical protein
VEALGDGVCVGDWVDSVSWKPLVPWGLFLVVEEDTIYFPLLFGIPAILLPLDFSDFVDTEHVFAEAAPFVVVHFVVGDVFLAVCDVIFWGSSSPSCVPSRTGLCLDTLGIVMNLMLMCLNVSLGVARLSQV